MQKNSFVYGVAVSDYNFTGREEETRRLKKNFEGGINSILISPRRWGKTSLVKHVCRQVDREKVIPVFLDMFTCRSEYDFYNALAAAVIKQTASNIGYSRTSIRFLLVIGNYSQDTCTRGGLATGGGDCSQKTKAYSGMH